MKNLEERKSQVVSVLAPAKLNLTLQILGKRSDNYHELFTLFQSIDLCDELRFDFNQADQNEIEILGNDTTNRDFPLDDSNFIKKAAKLYWLKLKKHVPVKITVRVKKNIPIGAGLAGGSADAAATLSAINRYYGNYIPLEQLLEMAATLGSDVPFSLFGGTSIGRGRGEILSPLLAQTNLYVILVKPKGLSISTPRAYDAFDQSDSTAVSEASQVEDHQSELISLLSQRDISAASKLFQNSFETVVFESQPVLQKIRERLIELGCFCAHMTGSGPTIFGLARDHYRANEILNSIANDQQTSSSAAWYKDHRMAVDTWLAKSIDHGVRVTANEETQ